MPDLEACEELLLEAADSCGDNGSLEPLAFSSLVPSRVDCRGREKHFVDRHIDENTEVMISCQDDRGSSRHGDCGVPIPLKIAILRRGGGSRMC